MDSDVKLVDQAVAAATAILKEYYEKASTATAFVQQASGAATSFLQAARPAEIMSQLWSWLGCSRLGSECGRLGRRPAAFFYLFSWKRRCSAIFDSDLFVELGFASLSLVAGNAFPFAQLF